MKFFFTLMGQNIRLYTRQKTQWSSLVLFFTAVIILMPIALGPEPEKLRQLGPGLIWLATLLMSLLSLDYLFIQDAQDGSLDEVLTSPLALEIFVLAKLAAHTLMMIFILSALLLPAILVLGMDLKQAPLLILTFILGIPALILLGGIACALTIALNRNAALMTLLLIPFYLPVLIFAVSACQALANGYSSLPSVLFLTALLVLILPSAPFIIAASLRTGQG